MIIIFCGLSGSGKSAIAKALAERTGAEIIRNDEIRKKIFPNPTYSEEEKRIVYIRMFSKAKSLHDSGKNVILDASFYKKSFRDEARKIGKGFLIFTKCPLEICMKRTESRNAGNVGESDKRTYTLNKKHGTLPGVSVPFEEPEDADLVLETDKLDVDESVEKILKEVKDLL